METLEKSQVCRLCGKHSGISIDIFDKNENHVRKINAILPILVHKMDLLPKQMCHRCSYKLEEFYNFYIDCAKTDSELKSQLSWMRKDDLKEEIVTPMVKVNPFKIKTEPPDCNDSDSNDVFGCISSYGSHASPILTCSRCRCLCNTKIKISTSPKEIKTSKESPRNQPCNSNVSNISKNYEEWNETVNKDYKFNKTACKTTIDENKIPMVVIDVNGCNSHDENVTEADLNRALRPRKCSVDYIGPKRKLVPKMKNKEDIFDPNLVNHVQVSVVSDNSNHPGPFIKLEKVDVKSLRARKNLEEFNKRIKQFNQTKKLRKEKGANAKSIQRLQKRIKLSFQKDNSSNQKSPLENENCKRQSLQSEASLEECSVYKTNGNTRDQSDKKSEIMELKLYPIQENQQKKDLSKNAIHENSCREQCLTNSGISNTNGNGLSIKDLQVKGEETQLPRQNKVCKIDLLEGQKIPKPLERLPMYPVVKLEKDYMCNVDYPRVKIKRHSPVAETSQLFNGTLGNLNEQKNIVLDGPKILSTKSGKSSTSKNSSNKEGKFKSVHEKVKSGKVSKKKREGLNLSSVKKVASVKKSSVLPESDFKHFCEKCDVCFQNRELYKLHPCYQN